MPDWRTADPLERYEAYLREQGVLDDADVEEIRAAAEEEIDDAVEAAEAVAPEGPDAVFDPVYAELTPRLREQRGGLRDFLAGQEASEQ